MNDFSKLEDKKYLLVGRYVVEFEHLVNSMRAFSRAVILISSDGNPNIDVANSVVVDLGAYQMACMAERLFFSFFKSVKFSRETKKAITNLFNQIKSVIEKRNLYVHGLWLIDKHYAQSADENNITYMKDKKKRDGVEIISEEINLGNFNIMIDECKYLANQITVISKIICERIPIHKKAESIEEQYVGQL
ncbi:hypothetical protein [Methylocucumis oryzae]|uniref:Uncharacterized protein n=1 Tax=Methylocucumis oryzae TaxID=1632867 RepID=A0A0F3IHT0_9GAMM|nr:hypothetical protein [Methylocucumis oryzae]KJV06360.1 hypothetical protein VZ94_11765 [Methylocucumis oryzae]